MLVVMLVLFGLYAKFVGIKTVYRGLDRNGAHGQRVSTAPSYPSNAFSGFVEVPVCLKSRFPAAKVFYDLSSFDKMVINSTVDCKAKEK